MFGWTGVGWVGDVLQNQIDDFITAHEAKLEEVNIMTYMLKIKTECLDGVGRSINGN